MIKLSNGNSKTGKGVLIFNIPAVTTCPGATQQCKKSCYAMKAQRMYPATRKQREENLVEAVKTSFVSDMVEVLNTNVFNSHVRIHESGDFFNQSYLDKWVAIAKKCKGKKFLAYTKSFHLDFSKAPKNLTIILSKFPDSPNTPESLSGLPVAYAGECAGMSNIFICGTKGGCSSCGKCWGTKSNIYFKLH
jgi:hypothetical protein